MRRPTTMVRTVSRTHNLLGTIDPRGADPALPSLPDPVRQARSMGLFGDPIPVESGGRFNPDCAGGCGCESCGNPLGGAPLEGETLFWPREEALPGNTSRFFEATGGLDDGPPLIISADWAHTWPCSKAACAALRRDIADHDKNIKELEGWLQSNCVPPNTHPNCDGAGIQYITESLARADAQFKVDVNCGIIDAGDTLPEGCDPRLV